MSRVRLQPAKIYFAASASMSMASRGHQTWQVKGQVAVGVLEHDNRIQQENVICETFRRTRRS